ncbi:HNH endonuclease [soil metagenome]
MGYRMKKRSPTTRVCSCGSVYSTLAANTWHCSWACLFWSRVDKQDARNCWLAHGENCSGYTRLRFDGVDLLAHRLSWQIHHGDIPAGMFVLHRCDNPPCVNPEHLFLGTKKDNAKDRDRKGRFVVLHGSLNGRAALDEEKVIDIKSRIKLGESNASIGRDYGVTKEAIFKIKHGLSWKRVA